MTERELLELLVEKVIGIEESQKLMNARLTNLEARVTGIEARLTSIEESQKQMDARLTNIEESQKQMEARLTSVENAQLRTETTIENTINKCIQILADGYKMNADTFKTKNFDMIEHDTKMAVAMSRMAFEKVNELLKAV